MRSVTLFTLAITLSSLLVEAGTCRVKNYGLPKCAKSCFKTAQNSTTTCPTDHIDLACLCAQAEIQKQIDSCLDTSCTGTDGAAAQYGKDLCVAAANATNTDQSEVSASASGSAVPSATSASEEWSATILPISDSPEASASASMPVQEDIAISSSAPVESSSRLAPPTVALAQAKDEPVVTITTHPGSQPSGDIPNSQGGAGRISVPGWIAVAAVGITTWVAL